MAPFLAKLIATCFYSGFFPKVPATATSFGIALVAVPMLLYAPFLLVLVFLLSMTLGWWAAAIYVRDKDNKDPREIVVDEAAGMSLSILMVYACIGAGAVFYWMLPLFFLFRFYDIFKPSLVGYADREWIGAKGVMMDDVFAGIFAGITLIAGYYAFITVAGFFA